MHAWHACVVIYSIMEYTAIPRHFYSTLSLMLFSARVPVNVEVSLPVFTFFSREECLASMRRRADLEMIFRIPSEDDAKCERMQER
jgi:hypothetical protein